MDLSAPASVHEEEQPARRAHKGEVSGQEWSTWQQRRKTTAAAFNKPLV